MNRTCSLSILLAVATGWSLVPSSHAEALVRAYVYGGVERGSGFIDPDTADSVRDLKSRLRGKKGLLLVDRAEDADVLIEVQRRVFLDGGYVSGRDSRAGKFSAAASDDYRVEAVLRAKNFERPFVGIDDNFWKYAAGDLAKQIDKWIRANRVTLKQ